MSSTGTENYSRIMLTLMKGGTKLTRGLVEKRVKDLSKNGEEDTIDEFLLKNKVLILQQKIGKNKQDVFFPLSGHTNLDYWDLCMFCFILEETCDLSNTAKERIRQLLKIRNKLCHISEPTLEKIKFENYTDKLKRIFENFLEEINDKKFTEEINALVQSFATGPLSIDDTLKAVHKLYHLEWTHIEVLEKIGNGQDLTNGKLDTLIEKVERLDSRWQSGASVDIQGIGLVIEVKNCSAEKKKEVLDILEKNFNEAIEQKVSGLEEDLPNGVLHTIRETVTQVFREFLIMGRHITFVEQKCLMLTIKCTSVKSFVNMIRDYRTGDLSLQLSAIETAIKNLQGCGNVQLENLIFKEEFMDIMHDLVSKLYEQVQETKHTAVQTSSNEENSICVTFKFPTLSERVTVQNHFETKMFGKGMKRIETELRRKLNVESMSLTTKLVKDDAVSNFAQQSDTSVMDEYTTVEQATETRQPRGTTALFEEEDTSTPSVRRDSQLISDESTHIFQGPVVNAKGKKTRISFDDNKGDMQIIKKTRCFRDKLQELSRNMNDLSTKTEINKLNKKAEGLCICVTKAFTVTGSEVLKENKKISRVSCPSRVDIERLSQTLLAFIGDLITCTKEIVSMKWSIHNFIGVNRCKIELKENEIKATKNEVDMLDKEIHLCEKNISKYEDKANNEERAAGDLENRVYDRQRKPEEHKERSWFRSTVSVLTGLAATSDASFRAGLITAGVGVAVNFDDADDCERTAAKFRESAKDKKDLAQRKTKSKAEYESKRFTKSIVLRNFEAEIDYLAKTCDGLASLQELLIECISCFERAIYIAQDFKNEVHRTLLQDDSFQLIKVFQEYPEEHHDETHEQMHKLKLKLIQLEQMLLINSDRHGISF